MYAPELSIALESMGYDPGLFEVSADDVEVDVVYWDASLGIQPTPAAVDAHIATQAFIDYKAEHGGDILLTLRRKAKAALDDSMSEQYALLRAAVIELALYSRDAHRNLNTLLDGIAAANNLAAVKSAAAAITQAPAPANDQTMVAGTRSAIKDRLTAGEADS